MSKTALITLCLFVPFVAVWIHDGWSRKVVWALVLQLFGHIPGVMYGLHEVTRD